MPLGICFLSLSPHPFTGRLMLVSYPGPSVSFASKVDWSIIICSISDWDIFEPARSTVSICNSQWLLSVITTHNYRALVPIHYRICKCQVSPWWSTNFAASPFRGEKIISWKFYPATTCGSKNMGYIFVCSAVDLNAKIQKIGLSPKMIDHLYFLARQLQRSLESRSVSVVSPSPNFSWFFFQ